VRFSIAEVTMIGEGRHNVVGCTDIDKEGRMADRMFLNPESIHKSSATVGWVGRSAQSLSTWSERLRVQAAH